MSFVSQAISQPLEQKTVDSWGRPSLDGSQAGGGLSQDSPACDLQRQVKPSILCLFALSNQAVSPSADLWERVCEVPSQAGGSAAPEPAKGPGG